MQETKKTKATSRLKGFDFSKDGSAVALVGPAVGGPANGKDGYLVLKNLEGFSPETIKKAQQIQVTMELPEFLERFFGMYGSDSEVLARLMGYVKPEEDESENDDDWWENYIEEKLSAFTVLKSLHEAKNLPEELSKLTEQDYLDVLTDQVEIEKALKAFDDKSSTSTPVEKTKVEAPASKIKKNKEKQMTQATDMVEKEKLVVVEKALNDQKVELEKALAQVKQFEEAQKQAIVKSKTDAVTAVLKDEKEATVVVKAVLALGEEDGVELLNIFKAKEVLIEKSKAFEELGANVSAEEDKPQESKLAQVIKSKYAQAK